MNVRALSLVAVLAAGSLSSGCPDDPRDRAKTEVVAEVGEADIRESDLLATLAQRGTARIPEPDARKKVARALLDEMITEQLMLGAAAKAGITVRDEDVDREVRGRAEGYPPGSFQRLLSAEQLTLSGFREKVRRRLVQDAFLRARLAEQPAITEDEVKARFAATEKERTVGEQVRARQILVKTGEEANHILEQVRARKLSFEQAAQRYSTAPDAETGGDLGWFGRGDMPDVFDICFNLEKGVISDVVISDYGFHIFQIVDYREKHTESLDEARAEIEQEIMREHQDAAYEQLMKELRAQTKISVHERAFDSVVARLPPAPVTPMQHPPEEHDARSLDSLPTTIDPVRPAPGRND